MAETDLYAPAAARGHREPRAAFGSTMAGKPNDTISLARLLRLHPTSSTPRERTVWRAAVAADGDCSRTRGLQKAECH